VDKIVGPGNIYVALAKRFVYGVVDIDMIAGPTEIVVLADETANPRYVAADLLSQAEHDEMASAILISTSAKLAEAVRVEVELQLEHLPKRKIAQKSIENHGVILLVDSIEEGIDVMNRLAPEHAEIIVEEPLRYLGMIDNAGSIFVGPYSSEPVGDYFAGPNHVLPTNGTARFSSPLNTDDFMKKSSIIYYSKQALLRNGQKIITLAEQEGLHGHAQAIRVRLETEGGLQ
jgi:histidinol dehydrogenase